MPRSIDEILEQADALAARFEGADDVDAKGATALRAVREAFTKRAQAERALVDAVETARVQGHSWASIGAMLGTSGEAARQRYGPNMAPKPTRPDPSISETRSARDESSPTHR